MKVLKILMLFVCLCAHKHSFATLAQVLKNWLSVEVEDLSLREMNAVVMPALAAFFQGRSFGEKVAFVQSVFTAVEEEPSVKDRAEDIICSLFQDQGDVTKYQIENFCSNDKDNFEKLHDIFERRNVAPSLKKHFSASRFSMKFRSQVQIVPLRPQPRKAATHGRDVVEDGIRMLNTSSESDCQNSEVLSSIVIATNFEHTMSQESLLERQYHEVLSMLEVQESLVTSYKNLFGDIELVKEFYSEKIPAVSNGLLDAVLEQVKARLSEAAGAQEAQALCLREVKNKLMTLTQNKEFWAKKLQEKLDEKNQRQQEFETKKRRLEDGLDKLSLEIAEIRKSSNALNSAKLMLVKNNLQAKLAEGAFNPAYYQ